MLWRSLVANCTRTANGLYPRGGGGAHVVHTKLLDVCRVYEASGCATHLTKTSTKVVDDHPYHHWGQGTQG